MSRDDSYCFIGACPALTGPFINYITDSDGYFGQVREVTYRTFVRHVDPAFVRAWRRECGYPLSQDTGVSYHRSRTPSGIPIYYFVWSAMEHVFVPCRTRFDLARETELAAAAQRKALLAVQAEAMEALGLDLPLNPDGTVTLYHGTTDAAAPDIVRGKRLISAGEPHVYVTTDPAGGGYGEVVVTVDVFPTQLELDDQFPDGRMDFRIRTSFGGILHVVRAR